MRLDQTFQALSDPTRRAILSRLAAGEASVGELAEPFAMTLPAVTKHLQVLERSGLIERSKDGQRRICRLRTEPMHEAADWLQTQRMLWEQRLDRLEDYLLSLQQAVPTPGVPEQTPPKDGFR